MDKLPFGFAKPQDSPGFLLWQTTITWQRLIKKALEPYKISHAGFVIMAISMWLDANKYETTQVAIASLSKLDKMTISKSLKILTKQALVKRSEHKSDSRAKSVYLTAKGKDLINKLVPIVEKIDADFFDTINKNQQKSFMKILKDLVN
jgi:DNA-binding MarR family transcriptional regulator